MKNKSNIVLLAFVETKAQLPKKSEIITNSDIEAILFARNLCNLIPERGLQNIYNTEQN